MDYNLNELVKKVDRLPTQVTIATKVVVLCSDPQTHISKLIEVISSDLSIFSQVLRIANSPYFNYPREITTLEQAITVLGSNLLKDVVLSIAIHSLYQSIKVNSDFNLNELWEHAFLTGLIGRALAEKYDPEKKDVLFIGGLFHDIGKFVQNQIIEKDFILIFIKSRRENEKLHILERRILGFHHGDIGGHLLQKWNLPEIVVQMVKFHHFPVEFTGEDEELRLIRFVYLSDLLAHFIQNNFRNIADMNTLDEEFNQYFTFSKKEFDQLINFTKQFISNQKTLKQIMQI